MPPLLNLPPELFAEFVKHTLPPCNDSDSGDVQDEQFRPWQTMRPILSLASACRALHETLSPRIYPFVAKNFPAVLFWACDRGEKRLVKGLLDAGLDPNRPLTSIDKEATGLTNGTPGDLPTSSFEAFDSRKHWDDAFNGHVLPEEPYNPDQHRQELIDRFHKDSDDSFRNTIHRANPWSRTNSKPLLVFPLHLAAHVGRSDIIELLIQHGAIIDVPSIGLKTGRLCIRPQTSRADPPGEHRADFYTPMLFAILSRSLEAVAVLERASSDSFFTEVKVNINAFHTAAAFGDEATIDLLLRDLKTWVANLPRPLPGLCIAYPLQYPDRRKCPPILHAQQYGNTATLEHLIRLGADVDGGTDCGYSPLIGACEQGQIDIVKKLIELGADVNIECVGHPFHRDNTKRIGLRPLDIVCQQAPPGSADIVRLLLAAGAEIRPKHQECGWDVDLFAKHDPLVAAAATHQPDVIRELLKHGADANSKMERCSFGLPLVVAVACCPVNSQLARKFPRRRRSSEWYDNSDQDSENDESERADELGDGSRVATSGPDTKRMLECVSVLLEHGADPDLLDNEDASVFDRLDEAQDPDFEDDHTLLVYYRRTAMSKEVVLDVANILFKGGATGKFHSGIYGEYSTSFLGYAYTRHSYRFCKSLVEYGATLGSDARKELRHCFGQLLEQEDSIAKTYRCQKRMKMVSKHDPENTRYKQAMELLVLMDPEGYLGSDPFFLASVLQHSTASSELVSFIFKRCGSKLEKTLQHSKYKYPGIYVSHTMLAYASMSGLPSRVEAVLDRLPKFDENQMTFMHTSLLLHVTSTSFTSSRTPTPGIKPLEIATLLLDRGVPVHWIPEPLTLEADDQENDDEDEEIWEGFVPPISCTVPCDSWTDFRMRHTPVAAAIENEDFEVLNLLLRRAPLTSDVSAPYHYVYLREAFHSQRVEVLLLLLLLGADPNARRPGTGETPLLAVLHQMDAATEECINMDWRESKRGEYTDRSAWIKRWVACVTKLLQYGRPLAGENGEKVLGHISKILEYDGSKWFRNVLKYEASRKWKIVDSVGEDGAAGRSVEVLKCESEEPDYDLCEPQDHHLDKLILYARRMASEKLEGEV